MDLHTLLKGAIIGGTMLVPGVSGGSMAMILGIYDKLISSISSFHRHKRESFLFLMFFSLSSGMGMLLFANPLFLLIEKHPMPLHYFFMGTVFGGIPLIFKQAEVKRISGKVLLYILVGTLIVILLTFIPAGNFQAKTASVFLSNMLIIAAGFIAAVALVLPGISVSYMLLILGLYDETMRAISVLDLSFLIPLFVGLLIGIILTTKMLEHAMTKHPQPTYLIILGFIIGSIEELFPGMPTTSTWLLCLIMLLAGFTVIRLITRWGNKRYAIIES